MLHKLRGLHSAIESYNLAASEQLDSWMENGRLIPASTNQGADQLRIGFLEYDAVLVLEQFANAPQLLMAIVCAWLIEQDAERDDQKLPAPDIDVEMVDDNSADVELRVKFREAIDLKKADGGLLAFNGNQWDLLPASVHLVDQAAVGDDQLEPTDLPYTRPEGE